MPTLINEEDPSLVPFSRGMIRPEDVIEEEIPAPNGRMFFGQTPYRGPSMNETGAPALPQVYGTASDNAYLSEQRALAGLDPRYARQQALMRADMEEQALQTQARLEYDRNFKQLIAGGANAAEAHIGAVSSAPVMGLLAQMNMKDPRKLALLAQGQQTGNVQGRPILGSQGEIIGYAAPEGAGQSITWNNANAGAYEQRRGDKITDRELDDARRKMDALNKERLAGGGANIRNPRLIAEEQAAQAAYEQLKQQARTGGKAVEAPVPEPKAAPQAETDKVRVVAPDGKTGTMPKSKLAEALKAGYKTL